MGIDPKIAEGMQKSMPGVQQLTGLFTTMGAGDEQSDLAEEKGKANASEIRRQAAREAAQVGEEREQLRSHKNTNWGGSGLAMTGSKALVRDADRLKDKQTEEDVLFQGDSEADAILQRSHGQANALRINGDKVTARSLMSLGSTIYSGR